MINKLCYIALIITMISCDYWKSDAPVDYVAQLGDTYLMKEEIIAILPENYTSADSTILVNNYINKWATENMLLKNANRNLSDEQVLNLDILVDKYKRELYTQAYLQQLTMQKMDTSISQSAMEAYFKEHNQEFKLNEDLVKMRYIHLDQNNTELDKVIESFKRFNEEDKIKLEDLALNYNSSALNDSIWVSKFSVFEKIALINAVNDKQIINPDKYWQLEDSLGVYLVKINDVLRRGDNAPLSYVQSTIKQVLRNQRKLVYIKKLEKDLLDDALRSNKLKINTQN